MLIVGHLLAFFLVSFLGQLAALATWHRWRDFRRLRRQATNPRFWLPVDIVPRKPD